MKNYITAKVKNLHDSILEPEHKGVIMVCQKCANQFSANKGDYWNLPDNYTFKCCNKVMKLAREHRLLVKA